MSLKQPNENTKLKRCCNLLKNPSALLCILLGCTLYPALNSAASSGEINAAQTDAQHTEAQTEGDVWLGLRADKSVAP